MTTNSLSDALLTIFEELALRPVSLGPPSNGQAYNPHDPGEAFALVLEALMGEGDVGEDGPEAVRRVVGHIDPEGEYS